MYKKVVPVLAVSAALTGCASTYVPVTDGPRATVTFRASSQVRVAFLSMFASRQCDGRQRVGLLDRNSGRELTTQVKADKELVATFKFVETASYNSMMACQATVVFVPKAGAQYEVTYYAEPTAQRCHARVTTLDERGFIVTVSPPDAAAAPLCTWS
jgi:hypothetical protein